MKRLIGLIVALLISGCAASVDIQKIQLESGRVYEVAKTRSGVEALDCGTQLVSYLFDEKGSLVDSKSERGQALHCDVAVSLIRAGGEIGAANQIRRGIAAGADTITNINAQSQGQLQGQLQGQANSNHWQGGSVSRHNGGHNGGNNGQGNGSGDGTNPGTGHHHDNGDNN